MPLGTLRTQVLAGSHAVDLTGGTAACYVVAARNAAGTITSLSDGACVIPRFSFGL